MASLPRPLCDGMGFFRAALEEKIITVPGEFFDVNPGKRRAGRPCFRQHVRLSFGPPMESIEPALARMEKIVER